jgi:GGDEF domain-containing protein
MQFDTRNFVNEQLPKLLKPGSGTIATTVLLGLGILCWPFLALLMVVALVVVVIFYVVRTQNQIQSLIQNSGIDAESNLSNRDTGLKSLELEAARAKDSGQPLGVLVIALKQSDGTAWNEADPMERDRIVRTAAKEMQRTVAVYDLIARVGVTTFLAIMPGANEDRILAVSTDVEKELSFGTMNGTKVKANIEMAMLAADEETAVFITRIKSLLTGS